MPLGKFIVPRNADTSHHHISSNFWTLTFCECGCAHTHMHMRTHACTHIPTHAHTCITHMCTHTCAHTHTHTGPQSKGYSGNYYFSSLGMICYLGERICNHRTGCVNCIHLGATKPPPSWFFPFRVRCCSAGVQADAIYAK